MIAVTCNVDKIHNMVFSWRVAECDSVISLIVAQCSVLMQSTTRAQPVLTMQLHRNQMHSRQSSHECHKPACITGLVMSNTHFLHAYKTCSHLCLKQQADLASVLHRHCRASSRPAQLGPASGLELSAHCLVTRLLRSQPWHHSPWATMYHLPSRQA